MRNYLLLLFLGFSLFAKAQAPSNKLVFEYDGAGNQVKRYLCLGCPSTTGKKANPKEIIALKEEDLQKFFQEDVISYYPNPVKEELYLKWELIADKTVTSIYLYDINGRVLKTYDNLDKANNLNILFFNYPTGTYLIVLIYNDGEQKTIKIVK
ncbi:T9SS type A sorting domain-containing protein [Flavobacterium restrictum]|uniref:T9SS type A sorting domain-containing protein n=1 Tax=Flavobacterium restrictum TaxID=2594428 RepID=A0A553E7C4_9FLAO|nr:T9SS type A sorting domain-containing protein [Flavobacterium restrictum]TRX40892.1 T9SS type A sorting domain-containing protein [Flavobacterium restrictum]